MTYHPLSLFELAIAGLLLIANAGLSYGFRLGLERTLLISAVRMALQLGAVGFVLKFVFEQGSSALTALFALVMITVASWEALSRQRYQIGSGWQHWGLGTAALLFCGLTGTLYAVILIINTDPWWSPRIFLPIHLFAKMEGRQKDERQKNLEKLADSRSGGRTVEII